MFNMHWLLAKASRGEQWLHVYKEREQIKKLRYSIVFYKQYITERTGIQIS